MRNNKSNIIHELTSIKEKYNNNVEQMYFDFLKMHLFLINKDMLNDFEEFINEIKIDNKMKKK